MDEHRFKHVSVLMGGISGEREISLRSGKAVAEGLRRVGYRVVEVDVLGRDFELPQQVEGVFIALHGTFGEDGQVQQILEERRVPYTGAGPEGSMLAFDKNLAKQILIEHGIPTPEYEVLCPGQQRTLPLPVVVKPVRQGSSLGVHRVTKPSEWDKAFADAVAYDGEVIVETYIEGKELTVGVVCDEVLPVIEIRAPDSSYDYRAKYTKGVTEYIVPAELDEQSTRACRQFAWQTFRALKCRGFGRIDLRMSPGGSAYLLELNTIPGFTETSLLPKAARAAGCEFPALCDRIMRTATLESI